VSQHQAFSNVLEMLVHAHPAAVHCLTIERLKRLVHCFPGALHVQTRGGHNSGSLPLHDACLNSVDTEVIL
jgi:hypothetical protein